MDFWNKQTKDIFKRLKNCCKKASALFYTDVHIKYNMEIIFLSYYFCNIELKKEEHCMAVNIVLRKSVDWESNWLLKLADAAFTIPAKIYIIDSLYKTLKVITDTLYPKPQFISNLPTLQKGSSCL